MYLDLVNVPGSFAVREPHDDAVDDGAVLAEVLAETVIGRAVAQAAQEQFSILFVVHSRSICN